jgi:hypothetical protein
MTYQEYRKRYLQDVDSHKLAEQIVLEVLKSLNKGYVFEDVADDEKYYSKGDIKMMRDGVRTRCIDVKDDQEIHETGNFAVEAGGYSKIYGYPKKGWIDSNYDYVAVISREAQTIWVLSFKKLKKLYNKTDVTGGRKVTSEFWDNVKYNYLIPIHNAIKLGIVLAKIEYEWDELFEEHTHTTYMTKQTLQAAEVDVA